MTFDRSPQYSIWVLEYGRVPAFPVGALVYGAHNAGTRNLPFGYVLVKGGGHLVMVDTGTGNDEPKRRLMEKHGLVDWAPPERVLGRIGVNPADVDTILVTHAHWDHMGNLDAFPHALVVMQRRELDMHIWGMALPRALRWFTSSVDPADLDRCVRLAEAGRLQLIDGDVINVLPGVDLHAAPDTHTFGSTWVAVRNGPTTDDVFVLAGDNVYVYENMLGWSGDGVMMPVGHVEGSNLRTVMAVDSMIRECGGDTRRVIPVHEARLADEYPSCASRDGLHVVEIALASGETSRVR